MGDDPPVPRSHPVILTRARRIFGHFCTEGPRFCWGFAGLRMLLGMGLSAGYEERKRARVGRDDGSCGQLTSSMRVNRVMLQDQIGNCRGLAIRGKTRALSEPAGAGPEAMPAASAGSALVLRAAAGTATKDAHAG